MSALYPIILCGGSGSRLWPMSRPAYPKQFLNLVSEEKSLLQQTVERLFSLEGIAEIIAVCSEDYRFIVAEQLTNISGIPLKIILEPAPKNTAPAVALGALAALQQDENAQILVLPADHVVTNEQALISSFTAARGLAEIGKLVTFGVLPSSAETGYGYIEKGAALGDSVANGFEIARFVEKPCVEKAQEFVSRGQHLWNSGMFLFGAEKYIAELAKFRPEMGKACDAAMNGAQIDLDFLRVDRESFSAITGDSIDYAVMEHTADGVVVSLDAGWSDIGSWEGLSNIADTDIDGNVIKGDVFVQSTKDCYFHSNGRLIAGIGLENIAVVETPDAILIAEKSQSQGVKSIVDVLKKAKRTEAHDHRVVYRPWGSYETICLADRFQVKKIIVKPGHKLSMQKHFHRAEHWVVVKGTALVTKDSDEFLLHEDESTYLPIGCVHRLENRGKIPLELIEVQSGSYLGEDDIVRFDDVYGRED